MTKGKHTQPLFKQNKERTPRSDVNKPANNSVVPETIGEPLITNTASPRIEKLNHLSSGDLLDEACPNKHTAINTIIIDYCGVSSEATNELLTLVARGEQDQAEAIISGNPMLVLEKGTVTDLSKRTFKEITAFQYALFKRFLALINWLLVSQRITPSST